MVRPLLPVLALLWFALCVSPALAQDSPLQHDAAPEFGVIDLAPGFTPDPLRIPSMTGGGEIDAVHRDLGPDCVGFVTATPDFAIQLSAGLPLLRLILIADAVTIDTTLIVRAPDGTFRCNNNTSSLFNPMVSIPGAAAGRYTVWIGGFTPNGLVYGDLFITTRADAVPGSTGLILPVATTAPTPVPPDLVTPTPAPGTFLDPSLPPAHADVTIAHGFLPDPFWTVVVGGGELAVPPLDPANPAACVGYVTREPDLRLDWSGASPALRFHVVTPEETTDAALIVRTPDGGWLCNADFAPGGYTDPSVEVRDPLEGVYTVWVANEAGYGLRFTGALYVTEINSTPETVQPPGTRALTIVAGLDPFSRPAPIPFDQNAPDPLALTNPLGFPGATVNLPELNPPLEGQMTPPCVGFVPVSPTLTVDLTFPYPYLRVFFVGAERTDPTLVVRMPDGRWFCNDDSYNSQQPTINILGPAASGIAQIWVGSFGLSDRIDGTLYFTRGSASPVNASVSTPFTGLTEINLSLAQPAQAMPTAVALATGPLTPGAPPNYGSAVLASANPPHIVAVIGGGDQDASKASPDCVGAVSAPPDYRFDWTGAAVPLRLFVTGEGDPTLVVLGPDGIFRCSDDSYDSVMPTVDLAAALSGAYFVWIGSFDATLTAPGRLIITDDLNRTPLNP